MRPARAAREVASGGRCVPRINIVTASWITAVLSMIYFSTAAAATVDNVVGIVADGSPVPHGGWDNDGYAYSATLLGTSVTWAGSRFTLGPVGTADAMSSTTIALPAGNDSTVNLLATAVNGNQVNQTFIVTYTDGSTTSFRQSLSDWYSGPQKFAGESVVSTMAYRIAPSGAPSYSTIYLYGYSFATNSAKTVQSITLPENRNVVVLAVNASPANTTAVAGTVDNVVGIVADGSPVPDGGLDKVGYAYSGTLLGTSFSWAGSTFTLGPVGTADAMSSTTIALPAGNDSTVNLLATAVNGNQVNQTFIVTYTDGSTTSFRQSLSDWFAPQQYAGESKVSEMGYRITPSGAIDNRTFYLYGYSFAINNAKTVRSITLPNNRNVVVLAVDATPAGTASFAAAAPNLSPAPGTYTSAQSVTLSDSTSGAVMYYTTNGATPTTNSAQYRVGTPIQISSTTTIEAIAVASGYSNSAVTGATFTITSAPTAPQITTRPANKTVTVGQTAAFSVVATGTAPLRYQWSKNGTPIAGATGSSYTTPATVSGDNGSSFTVVVTNATGSMTSNAAMLTVTAAPTPPTIITQPSNVTIPVGSSATFSVATSGSGLSYQWNFDGAAIAGANSSSYTISSAAASNTGNYSVLISNSVGSVTSAPATLVVNASAPPTFTLSSSCATAVVVGLQWGVADPTVTQYHISRNGVSLATTPNLYFADTNVVAKTSYNYVVTARNSSGATLTSNTLSLESAAASTNGDPAYCPSSLIKSMTWNWTTAFNQQNGSDLWSVTWGSNGNVFAFFGDGGGFGGSDQNGRTSFGIAEIDGLTPLNSGNVASNTANLFGGYQPGMAAGQSNYSALNGKASSIIAVGADLYSIAGIYRSTDSGGPSNVPNHQEIAYSTSSGTSWTDNFWLFCSDSSEPSGFCPASFINFGRGNAGARDGYVYIMGTTEANWFSNAALPGPAYTYLARVPNAQLLTQTAYEVFTGFDSSGSPTWGQLYSGAQSNGDPIYVSTTVMQPIFTDHGPRPIGIGQAVYNPTLGRYIAVGQGSIAQAAFYESVNPWGPWYNIAYYNTNSDGSGGWGNMGMAGSSLGIHFVNAWTSSDGLTMWATFSSTGTAPTNISDPALAGRGFDSFNLISVVLGL
jgi:hypothetical protein